MQAVGDRDFWPEYQARATLAFQTATAAGQTISEVLVRLAVIVLGYAEGSRWFRLSWQSAWVLLTYFTVSALVNAV